MSTSHSEQPPPAFLEPPSPPLASPLPLLSSDFLKRLGAALLVGGGLVAALSALQACGLLNPEP